MEKYWDTYGYLTNNIIYGSMGVSEVGALPQKKRENGPNDVHQIPGVRPVGRLPVFSESLRSMFVPLMNMKSMMHAEVS